MSVPYNVQLVVYAPNGARIAPLPDVISCSPTSPFNAVGSLQFTYPKDGRNVELINSGYFEIAVEIDHGSGYGEPDGFRFLSLGRSDEGTEQSGELSFDLPSYSWLLKKSRINSFDNLNADGNREFDNANAGTIMATLIYACQARGVLPGLGVTFNGSNGSNGAPWTVTKSIEYNVGTDLAGILDGLAEEGLCDWTTRGRDLIMVPSDTGSTDHANIVLRYGVDLTEGPNKLDATNLLHSVVVHGDDTAWVWMPQPAGTPAPWGTFEDYLTSSGVTDAPTLNAVASAALLAGSEAGEELTRTIQLDESRYAPLRDFDVGDWISAPGLNGTIERLRVREIAVTKDSNGVAASLMLKDRFLHATVSQLHKIAQAEQAANAVQNDFANTVGDWNTADNGSIANTIGDWSSTGYDGSFSDWAGGGTDSPFSGYDYGSGSIEDRMSHLEQCCSEVGARLEAIENKMSIGGDVQVFRYGDGSLDETDGSLAYGKGTWHNPGVGDRVIAMGIGCGGDGGEGMHLDAVVAAGVPTAIIGATGGAAGGYGEFAFMRASLGPTVEVWVSGESKFDNGLIQIDHVTSFAGIGLAGAGNVGRTYLSDAVTRYGGSGAAPGGWGLTKQGGSGALYGADDIGYGATSSAGGSSGGKPDDHGGNHVRPVKDPDTGAWTIDPDTGGGLGGVTGAGDDPGLGATIPPSDGGNGTHGYNGNSTSATYGGGGGGGGGVSNVGARPGIEGYTVIFPFLPIYAPIRYAKAGDGGDGGLYGGGGGGGGANEYDSDYGPYFGWFADDGPRPDLIGHEGKGGKGVCVVITR